MGKSRTANARPLGSRQVDALKKHSHELPGGTWDTFSGATNISMGGGTSGTVIGRGTTVVGTSVETRPINVALVARLHV